MGIFKRENNIISYTIDKTFAKNFSISICEGQVAVSVPWYASRKQINQIVEEKKNWIMQKLEEYEKANEFKKNKLESKRICVLGKEYLLKINYKVISYPELNLENEMVKINLPVKYRNIDNTKIIEIVLSKFYKSVAEKEIENLMEKFRKILGIAPEDYKIEKMDFLLGKFSFEKKEIIINPDIVKFDKKIMEFVILHEFCHLKYKTHGKNFNKLMEKNMPEYEEIQNKIKGLF